MTSTLPIWERHILHQSAIPGAATHKSAHANALKATSDLWTIGDVPARCAEKEIDLMHPLMNQQMAQFHREELQREIRTAHLADRLRASRRGKNGHSFSHALLWYLLLRLRESVRTNEQEDRLATMSRVIGMAALGVGLLAGSFLSIGPGMFLAVLLGVLLCAAVSLPILARAVMLLCSH